MVAPLLVQHAGGRYPVIVRSGGRGSLSTILEERHPGARAVVIADDRVAAIVGSPLATAALLTFPAGEANKTRASWVMLTDRLLALRCDRDTVLVATGGGVTTDLVGFVAATFLRGVPWVAMPTTTLGMLDAAIGGKTGVDTPAGKNLVGAFHQPTAVLIDPDTLQTLPERNYREGLAEAVKHAATLDATYGQWMHSNAARIAARDSGALEALIKRSVALKADIVTRDEREGDRRAVLNAGHTVAHALERATDYGIPHGEAVAIGLVVETRVAEATGVAARGTADEIVEILTELALPTTAPAGLDRQRFREAMQADKKNRGGVVYAALISRFGRIEPDGESWTRELDLRVLDELL